MLVKLVFYALMAGTEGKINKKQGIKDLRFEQRHFNCLETWLFLESQFLWECDWLGENKKRSISCVFYGNFRISCWNKSNGVSLCMLHYTSQSILPVNFLRLHACFSSFLSFGCFQEVNDGEKLAGNNNNFTWRIRGFTLRRGIRCRWFGRRCRHWFVYHIQHINAFETT